MLLPLACRGLKQLRSLSLHPAWSPCPGQSRVGKTKCRRGFVCVLFKEKLVQVAPEPACGPGRGCWGSTPALCLRGQWERVSCLVFFSVSSRHFGISTGSAIHRWSGQFPVGIVHFLLLGDLLKLDPHP